MAPRAHDSRVLLVGQSASPVGRSIARALAGRSVRVHETPNVYEAVVLLAQRSGGVDLAFVDVDGLTDAEMDVFGFVHRRWRKVAVVAFGRSASGRRLAAAAAGGAVSVIAGPLVNGQLDDLLPAVAAPTPSQPPAAASPAVAAGPREILTEAEMSALLGDGSDAPAFPPAGAEDASDEKPPASAKSANVKRKRKRKNRKKT